MKKPSYIVVLNAGSATLKFGLFDAHPPFHEITSGNFERVMLPNSFLAIGKQRQDFRKPLNYRQALRVIFRALTLQPEDIKTVGHRIVHGGTEFIAPTVLTPAILRRLERYGPLAPLHNPHNLTVARECLKVFPHARQVAVFDTAYFAHMDPAVATYAIPFGLSERLGIRRYGFHGISHQAAGQAAANLLGKPIRQLNLITIHLGSGCSITAIRRGVPIRTSLGFSTLDGLVMGTRAGDLDPAVPLFLQQQLGWSAARVERLLYRESGLLGISGFTSDMREILKAAGVPVTGYHGRATFTTSQRRRARLALAVFTERLRDYIAWYAGLLGRVDALVFTGGIGERSAAVRRLATRAMHLRPVPRVLTVPANEERAIVGQLTRRYTGGTR
ncbi:MAG: acetate/propionate family kinase [Patescibacteria group bacterium]